MRPYLEKPFTKIQLVEWLRVKALSSSSSTTKKKKLKTDLPYDPEIPLLGIYLKECESVYNKDTCTPMFIATLFTIAKLWKQ
jgi:hypothetical protein